MIWKQLKIIVLFSRILLSFSTQFSSYNGHKPIISGLSEVIGNFRNSYFLRLSVNGCYCSFPPYYYRQKTAGLLIWNYWLNFIALLGLKCLRYFIKHKLKIEWIKVISRGLELAWESIETSLAKCYQYNRRKLLSLCRGKIKTM